jgi:hypothetical protein
VVGSGQRVVRAQYDLARSGRPGRAKQQIPGGEDVIGVAVVPLAGYPVMARLRRLAPGVLEVVHRRAKGRPAQAPQRRRELMPEAGLARAGQAVNADPEPAGT